MQITCPHCGAAMIVPPEYAGKRVKCGQCKHELVAPAEAQGVVNVDVQAKDPIAVDPSKVPAKKKAPTGLLLLLIGGLAMMMLGCVVIGGVIYWMNRETPAVRKTRVFFPDSFRFLRVDNLKNARKYIPSDYQDDTDEYPGTKIEPDDIDYVMNASSDGNLTILCLNSDLDLEDVVSGDLGESNRSNGVRVYKLSRGFNRYVAKIDKKIVAFASKEKTIEEAIENYQDGKKNKLNEYEQKAFNVVKKYDRFAFGEAPKELRKAKSAAIGWSYRKGIKSRMVVVFRDKDAAEKGLEVIEDKVQERADSWHDYGKTTERKSDKKSSIPRKKSATSQKYAERNRKRNKRYHLMAEILEGAKIRRKGNMVQIDLSISDSEIEDVADLEDTDRSKIYAFQSLAEMLGRAF